MQNPSITAAAPSAETVLLSAAPVDDDDDALGYEAALPFLSGSLASWDDEPAADVGA